MSASSGTMSRTFWSRVTRPLSTAIRVATAAESLESEAIQKKESDVMGWVCARSREP